MDASGGWRERAACLGMQTGLFYRVQVITVGNQRFGEIPDPAAKKVCDRCPVWAECFEEGRAKNEHGTWGGTSEWQRQQLKRRHRRAMCPVCRIVGPIIEIGGNVQACVACGQSWRATPVKLRPVGG